MAAELARDTTAEPIYCYRCGAGDPRQLFGRIGGRYKLVCAQCWHYLGCPWPRNEPPLAELAAAEARTRDEMLRRGGTDRHLVRSGKS